MTRVSAHAVPAKKLGGCIAVAGQPGLEPSAGVIAIHPMIPRDE
jgi:hypothetical protein